MNTRSFVIEDHDEDDLRSEIRQEMVGKLATEWNLANNRLEERSFRSEDDCDAEADFLADQADNYLDSLIEKAIKEGQLDEELVGQYNNNTKQRLMSDEDRIKIAAFYDAGRNEFYQAHQVKANKDAERLAVIESMLSELGARMARPYEHWNEDEKYMEYMERDRDYE